MVGVNGKVLWKGPRVSTTVHMGTPSFEMDHQSGHMIYVCLLLLSLSVLSTLPIFLLSPLLLHILYLHICVAWTCGR